MSALTLYDDGRGNSRACITRASRAILCFSVFASVFHFLQPDGGARMFEIEAVKLNRSKAMARTNEASGSI